MVTIEGDTEESAYSLWSFTEMIGPGKLSAKLARIAEQKAHQVEALALARM